MHDRAMTESAAFTWLGGYYELALELGPTSDERLARALTALSEAPTREAECGNRLAV
jgi:hypothetical protein